MRDDLNFTPLLFHAQTNPIITRIIINLIKDNNLIHLFKENTNTKDNILHILAKNNNNLHLIKLIVHDVIDILNDINDMHQTPVLIATINAAEDVFYLFNSLNANLNILDYYGNTVEHYICLNEICVGMEIKNKENIFGYTPQDYCKISDKYYMFIID